MNIIKQEFHGDIALVPFLSDSFFQLLNDLVTTSQKFPNTLSYPAGAIIISVACIESYINELVHMHQFSNVDIDNRRIKNSFEKLGTDILNKIIILREKSHEPANLNDDLIDDVRLLIALRGRVAHYSIQEEYPNNKELLSKFEKLEKHLFGEKRFKGNASTERLLNPAIANICQKIVVEIASSLYKCGYEPPRPRWVQLVDPKRFGNN